MENRARNGLEFIAGFVNGVTGRENGFEQLPESVRSMMMENAESLKGETDSSALPRFSRNV